MHVIVLREAGTDFANIFFPRIAIHFPI
jgi:hypothetical protein